MSVTLLINAVDKTADCLVGSAQFTQPVRGFRGTSKFTIRQLPTGPSYTPVRGHSVQWKDGSVVVFRGTIDTFDKKPMVETGGGFFYEITAVSPEQRIDKRFVTRAFASGTTCGAIVASIMATELATEGISVGNIDDGATLTIPKVYDHARISDVFSELASLSDDYTWYIDPADGLLYFQARTTTAAPFSVTDGDVQASTGAFVSFSRSEYRNRQHVKISESNLVPEVQTFSGDGATDSFTLNKSIREIVSIRITTATSSQIVGTFNSTPSDGDAIVIGGWQYMFVDVMPPPATGFFTQAVNFVLIGRGNLGTLLEDTVDNLVAAIMDSGEGKGDYYSPTTIKNQAVSACTETGTPPTTFEITVTSNPGYTLDTLSSTASFTWGTPTEVDSGTSSFQSFVERSESTTGAAEYQWTYDLGGTTIEQLPGNTPPQAGELLVVEYKPIGFGTVTVDDIAEIEARATAEGGSGIYENLAIREDILTMDAGIAAATALLLANINMTERVTFDTDVTGLFPGQYVAINDTALGVNSSYLIQSVTATIIPAATGHYWRYRVLAVSGTQTTIEAWAALANKGSPNGIGKAAGGHKTSPQEIAAAKETTLGFWFANFGLDDDTVGTNYTKKKVPITIDGAAYSGWVTVDRLADAGSDSTVIDILSSDDKGETWTSIFGPNNADKIVIPATVTGTDQDVNFEANPRIREITNFKNVSLKRGWMLRPDVLQGGGATDIHIWIVGKPSGSRGQMFNFGSPGIGPLVLI
jgi:hypothetical protein